MQIAAYNRRPSKIDFQKEILSLYPYTLLGNKILLKTSVTNILWQYYNFDRLSDRFLFDRILHYYRMHEDYIDGVKKCINLLKDANKKIKDKSIEKEDLVIIGRTRSLANRYKKNLKEYLESEIKKTKLFELMPFIDTQIWKFDVVISNLGEPDVSEDLYIPELTKVITEKEYFLAFNPVVEDLFSYCLFDSNENDEVEFIKIPLWHFTTFEGITFLQMKYTFEEIRPSFIPFFKFICDFPEQLFKKSFIEDNIEDIKQLCKESIVQYIEPFQNVIDNSLYLNQLRNKNQTDRGITFCLGITSVENLIEFYSRSEIVEPYVALQIKQQVGREMDLMGSCIFVYCTF